jgi:hypothetical protein
MALPYGIRGLPVQTACHRAPPCCRTLRRGGRGAVGARSGLRSGSRCAALSAAIDLYHSMDLTFWLPQAEATLAQVA